MKPLLPKLAGAAVQKSSALFLTALVIGVLVMAGPAQAFSLSLTLDEDSVEQGKKLTFIAEVEVEEGDANLPLENITLVLEGPETITCSFDATGKKLGPKECQSFNIKKIPKPQLNYGYGYGYGYNSEPTTYHYGYGYGYGYGYHDFGYGYGVNGPQTLRYEITWHTQHHEAGNYSSTLLAEIGDKTFVFEGPALAVTPKEKGKDKNDEEKDDEFLEDYVAVCHLPPGNPQAAHTLYISENAIEAHLAHGDAEGACEDLSTSAYKKLTTKKGSSSGGSSSSHTHNDGSPEEVEDEEKEDDIDEEGADELEYQEDDNDDGESSTLLSHSDDDDKEDNEKDDKKDDDKDDDKDESSDDDKDDDKSESSNDDKDDEKEEQSNNKHKDNSNNSDNDNGKKKGHDKNGKND